MSENNENSRIPESWKWFPDARFGMFIHWGLYSLAGGIWNGMETPWVSEWMMRKFQIPVREYEKLAASFNPVGFDAMRWAETIRDAGMKYVVITAKHHDGFAMYHSSCDRYNITDMTPFRRDPLEELAEACRKTGLRLGFYYSQDQDWHEPGASGNNWDFPAQTPDAFAGYLERKVVPQLHELLTGYGDISIIWFDTPLAVTDEQSRKLSDYVHSLQPGCLVSGRVGNNKGDYESLDDNEMPCWRKDRLCEGLGTMNESWGYKPSDHNYRSSVQLLRNLCELTGKNANYLLNVGPDGNGEFPPEANVRLREIGNWIAVNGEAVHGAGASPTPAWFSPQWGFPTAKKDALYLNVFARLSSILPVFGFRNRVLKAEILGHPSVPVTVTEDHRSDYDYHRYGVSLPDLPLPYTVKLSMDGELNANVKAYNSGNC